MDSQPQNQPARFTLGPHSITISTDDRCLQDDAHVSTGGLFLQRPRHSVEYGSVHPVNFEINSLRKYITTLKTAKEHFTI